MKDFKIRASASGKLMTNPQKKTDTISKTTISYLQEWTKEQLYGVRKEISNKYMTKGTFLENEAIDKAITWANLDFAIKNENYFEDDFFCGTPDIICADYVVDTKVSWDCFTFPLFDDEIPTDDYFYQLQIYMALCGKRKAKLVYVLLNTPDTMVYETPHNYDGLDPKYRCKVFDIEYQPEVIEELKKRVFLAREYINNLTQNL